MCKGAHCSLVEEANVLELPAGAATFQHSRGGEDGQGLRGMGLDVYEIHRRCAPPGAEVCSLCAFPPAPSDGCVSFQVLPRGTDERARLQHAQRRAAE